MDKIKLSGGYTILESEEFPLFKILKNQKYLNRFRRKTWEKAYFRRFKYDICDIYPSILINSERKEK